jgi:hypothetical protein
MTGRRSKVIVAVLVVLAALFFLNHGQFTDFMDVSTMRLMMLGLIGVVTLQAVGLYVLARRPTTETTTEPNKVFETEQRGRGRPRKPCSLALTGVLQCPLEPNLELDTAFISRVSVAVADFQHKKLGTVEKKLVDLEEEKVTEPSAKTEENPPEQSKDKKVEGAPESKREEGIGELVVDMTEVKRKAEKEKEDKKEDKREKTGK